MWKYTGVPLALLKDDPGRGIEHLVIEADGGEVVTWSAPSPSGTGYSWFGLERDFLERFEFVPG